MNKLERIEQSLNPRSIAIIGASSSPERVGYNILESIVKGGFKGEIFPVNPQYKEILGLKVYASIREIKKPVDLAVIVLNQFASVEMLKECGEVGVKGAVVIAGGYKEMGPDGKALQDQLAAAAKAHGMVLIGPNTLGLINTRANLNATFYPDEFKKSAISFISQSGAYGCSFIYKLWDHGIGINKWIGVGNQAVLGVPDILEYYEHDETTKLIGIFFEGTDDIQGFCDAAKRIVPKKPIIVVKAGKSELAKYSALTHTGTDAGSDEGWQEIFKQTGVLGASSANDMAIACKTLSIAPLPRGENLFILTHTAGPSIMATEVAMAMGCSMPPLAEKTKDRIAQIIGNVPVILKNPVDVAAGGFAHDKFGHLADVILQDEATGLLLACYQYHTIWGCPSQAIIEAKQKNGKPIIMCLISTYEAFLKEKDLLQENGVPLFQTPEEAATAAVYLINYYRFKSRSAEMI